MTDFDQPLIRKFIVSNSLGLHARVAARIAETVRRYGCEVHFRKDSIKAEADSVLSLLILDAPKGTELEVMAKGPQAVMVLDELQNMFASGFGE